MNMFHSDRQIDINVCNAIVEQMIEHVKTFNDVPLGKATEFTCHCGGTLHQYDPTRYVVDAQLKKLGNPRYSRKSRLRKKFRKAWNGQHDLSGVLALRLKSWMSRPSFKCCKCGVRHGFYETIGRSLVHVEPMPKGADVMYECDDR